RQPSTCDAAPSGVDSVPGCKGRPDCSDDGGAAGEPKVSAQLVDCLEASAVAPKQVRDARFAKFHGRPFQTSIIGREKMKSPNECGDTHGANDLARVLDGVNDTGVAAAREQYQTFCCVYDQSHV